MEHESLWVDVCDLTSCMGNLGCCNVTWHLSRYKLWVVVVGGALAMLVEIYDFPPYKRHIDAHSLWHASTIPLMSLVHLH